MIWQPEAVLAILWVCMAAWQAHLIDKQRPIKHGWWAALSGLLIAGACVWSRLNGWPLVLFAFAQGCGRLVVFNLLLNWLRRLSWDYESPTTGSIMDQLERKLFGGRVWLLEVLLIGVYVALQLFFI